YLAATIAGVVIGAAVLFALGIHHFAPVAEVIYIAIWVGAPILMTWLGRLIASGIDRTGVARGLQLPLERPRSRGTGGTLHMAAA
ncbi:MAG: hypothetical protein ACTJHU_03590, partial [Mycetocola sp.]